MHKQEIHAGGEIFQRLPDFTKDNLHFTGVMDRERPGQCGEIVICSTLYLIIADPVDKIATESITLLIQRHYNSRKNIIRIKIM